VVYEGVGIKPGRSGLPECPAAACGSICRGGLQAPEEASVAMGVVTAHAVSHVMSADVCQSVAAGGWLLLIMD
jgi:hypothetical protein